MDKVTKKTTVIGTLSVIILVCLLIVFWVMRKEEKLSDKIYNYALKNEQIRISALTDFDWDVAYLDYERYGTGEQLKRKWNLTGDFSAMESDTFYRIAFYDNNTLVYDCVINEYYCKIDSKVEQFDSETLFFVSKKSDAYGYEIVYLKPTDLS